MGARAVTRTEQVYGSLRADILSGRLEPGARLPFAELTERYGASMGALREALHRLAEQGLVTNEPQLGFRVQSLSVDDLRDLTTARCEIEGLALRYAIAHGDLAWESEIVAAFYALERTLWIVFSDPASRIRSTFSWGRRRSAAVSAARSRSAGMIARVRAMCSASACVWACVSIMVM